MKSLDEIKDIEELIPGELYTGEEPLYLGEEIDSLPITVMIEKFAYDDKRNREIIKTEIKRNRTAQENEFFDAGGTKIHRILEDENALCVLSKASRYELSDLLGLELDTRLKNPKAYKLNENLIGALACEVIKPVHNLHIRGLQHNNVSTERYFLYEDGSLCLFSNYDSTLDSIKRVQPSTIKRVPEEIIKNLPQNRCFPDLFETAMVIHQIFTKERLHDMASFKYERHKKMPRKVYNTLANILDKEKNANFKEDINSEYLLSSFERYEKYSEKLRKIIIDSYDERFGKDITVLNEQRLRTLMNKKAESFYRA